MFASIITVTWRRHCSWNKPWEAIIQLTRDVSTDIFRCGWSPGGEAENQNVVSCRRGELNILCWVKLTLIFTVTRFGGVLIWKRGEFQFGELRLKSVTRSGTYRGTWVTIIQVTQFTVNSPWRSTGKLPFITCAPTCITRLVDTEHDGVSLYQNKNAGYYRLKYQISTTKILAGLKINNRLRYTACDTYMWD